MAPWHDGLEGVHRSIAADPSTPLHVLAGPGTGKTFAMMRRIARLLEEGVNPTQILAISFTRTAAKDLREQLERLHAPGAGDVAAATLHSFCFKVLNQAAVFQQTHRTPRPLLSFEVRYLELDLKTGFGGLRTVRRLLAAYEAAWARMQTEVPGGPTATIDAQFHAATTDWLRYHQAMLIGELVPITLQYIQNNPASESIPNFQHVLVDEYQDLNKAEQELIDLISANGTLTVIGDDCQSIYSFRHANPEGIRTFPQERPGTTCLTIEECRRCPPNIVRMSNALISHEPNRTRATPLTPDDARANAHVVVVQHRTLDDEVTAIGDYIVHFLNEHPDLPPGQVLVLTPRRFIGNRIRDAIISRGLNAISYFAEDPVQPAEAAEGYALLTLLVNIDDRPALRAWLGMGSQEGRAGGYRRLRSAAVERGQRPREVLELLSGGSLAIPHAQPLVVRWNELNRRLDTIRNLKGLELVRAIWHPENENCDDIRLMAEILSVSMDEPDAILQALRQELTQPHLPDSGSDIVRVMSLHKSKGLTASLVVVAGCMAGALPRIDPDAGPEAQAAQLEEQRRLFYVAITRATHTLILSSSVFLPFGEAMQAQVQIARRRWLDGQPTAETSMSPFISEMGPVCPRPINESTWRRTDHF